jgi:hypothetical protein
MPEKHVIQSSAKQTTTSHAIQDMLTKKTTTKLQAQQKTLLLRATSST